MDIEFWISLGWIGLILVSFMESSFFPIPPDLLLIPLVINSPEYVFQFALLTTIFSVLGAVVGYYIGLKLGRPILEKLTNKYIKKVEMYFEKYGVVAVFISAFTPIPFKIFTIASGIFRVPIFPFIFYAFLGRGLRFFIESYIILLGLSNMNIFTFLILLIVIVLFYVKHRFLN